MKHISPFLTPEQSLIQEAIRKIDFATLSEPNKIEIIIFLKHLNLLPSDFDYKESWKWQWNTDKMAYEAIPKEE